MTRFVPEVIKKRPDVEIHSWDWYFCEFDIESVQYSLIETFQYYYVSYRELKKQCQKMKDVKIQHITNFVCDANESLQRDCHTKNTTKIFKFWSVFKWNIHFLSLIIEYIVGYPYTGIGTVCLADIYILMKYII